MNSGYASSFGPRNGWHYFIQPYTPLAKHTGHVNTLTTRSNFFLCPSRGYRVWNGAAGTHASWARSQLVARAQRRAAGAPDLRQRNRQ
jgi:hypothetical protein